MRRTLWAAAPSESTPAGFTRLFPSELEPDSGLSHQDVVRLTREPYELYDDAVAAAARVLAKLLPKEAAPVLAREPAVLLTYLFLDRALRLQRHLERAGSGGLAVAAAGPLPHGISLESLAGLASGSQAFNQSLALFLAQAFELPIEPAPPAALTAPQRSAANLNFDQPGIPTRFRRKAARLASRMLGRHPALGLAYAEWCFLDRGLIGPGYLADLNLKEPLPAVAPQAPLRQELAGAFATCRPRLDALLRSWGCDERLCALYPSFMVQLYPADRLEGAPGVFASKLNRLRRYEGRRLYLSEIGDANTAYMLAAGRNLGLEIVGIQHGAHYGFSDFPCHTELEFPQFDRFITWGWRSPPPRCAKLRTEPLPSPWLSERAAAWKTLLGGKKGRRLLVVTDRIQTFPPTLNTLRTSRLDYLAEMSAWLKDVVASARAAGIPVLHKPFNEASALALQDTIRSLQGPGYELYEPLDKGLSESVLSGAALTIWDEPGTGLFECLTAGIPAMLYWRRAMSAEGPQAPAALAELEAAGLAHRDAASLTAALRRPYPHANLAPTLREYAWTDPSWPELWKEHLSRP